MNKKIFLTMATVGFIFILICTCSAQDARDKSLDSEQVSPQQSSKDKPLEPDRAYNQGVDFYHKLDYNNAAELFKQSMNTEDRTLEQYAAYNLGSAFFNQGLEAEKQDPQAANQLYKKSVDFFKRSIEIDPDDLDAKYNFELAKKKMIEQEQKAKQQQKQDQKDQQEQKDKNKDQNEQKDKQDQKDSKDQNDKQEQKEQNKDEQQEPRKPESDKQENQKSSSSQQQKQRQMTEQEAKMLLENFQQSEQQKKKQELYDMQQRTLPGVKGW
jgi:hypothetical protein